MDLEKTNIDFETKDSSLCWKKLFTGKKSLFKFFSALLIFIGICMSIIHTFIPWPTQTMKEPIVKSYDIGDSLLSFFCYFTTQSNLFVLFWFAIIWIRSDWEGKRKTIGSFTATLSIAVYISITFLIYNLVLLPTGVPSNALGWIETIILHMVGPILFIIYFLFLYKHNLENKITFKHFFKKDLYKIFIYPVLWFLVMEPRGIMRSYSQVPYKERTAYMYFFMNPTNDVIAAGLRGWEWLIIIFIVVVLLLIGLSSLYLFCINKKIEKNLSK